MKSELLSTKDYDLLLTLESNPLANYSELADSLNQSWVTVKKRVQNLQKQGIIRNPSVEINNSKLGLDRVNIMVELANFDKVRLIEMFCDLHPYTLYRARVFGKRFGMFIQFNIPKGSLSLLEESLRLLLDNDILLNFEILDSINQRVLTNPDLRYFNIHSLDWDFSWREWLQHLKTIDSGPLPEIESTNELKNIKMLHLELLRKFTENATYKQTEFLSEFDLTKSTASRYYTYVMNNLVSKVRFNYDHSKFNLANTYLVVIPNLDEDSYNRFYWNFKKNPPTMKMSLELISRNSIILWGSMSTKLASEFALLIWKEFPMTRIYTLITTDESAASYWFYHENFNESTKDWKKDYNYMVQEPLKEILLKNNTNK
jgi:DNA-binding Lrp family transcriptional regulator